jgi:hypothetical protein
MEDLETSEVKAKLTPVNVGLWKAKFGNHGNHTIPVWIQVAQDISIFNEALFGN